jgi:hypothetical protein
LLWLSNRSKAALTLVLVLCWAGVLSACSPDLDWREFTVPLAPRSGDDSKVAGNAVDSFSAMLPGRYSEESRSLPDGSRMQWWSAKARDCVFGIGLTELAEEEPMALARTTAYLAANIGGQARVLQQSDGSNGALSRDIAVTGQAGAQAVELRGRLILRGRQLLQAVVIMPASSGSESTGAATLLNEAEIENFLGGLRWHSTTPATAPGTAPGAS